MNEFEKTIKAYLDQRASEDEEFAKKYKDSTKTIYQCCAYIISEVQKSGRRGFTDDEVYGMAVHYYDEADIKVNGGKSSCQVVVNHIVELTDEEDKEEALDTELTDEEKAKAREQAIKDFQAKVMEDMKHKKPAPQKNDDVLKNQLNMFGDETEE